MLRFLFDTDHLTLYERGHPLLTQRLAAQPAGAVGVSAVTVEEALRGRLGALSRARDGPTRIYRYLLLVQTFHLLHQFPIVVFDQVCENQFQQLLALRLRVGTQDLKMAACARANSLTLLTRNRRDFARIPGIVLDDWST
jgi:tRNA(fMet)-specific endonuclease VapC